MYKSGARIKNTKLKILEGRNEIFGIQIVSVRPNFKQHFSQTQIVGRKRERNPIFGRFLLRIISYYFNFYALVLKCIANSEIFTVFSFILVILLSKTNKICYIVRIVLK